MAFDDKAFAALTEQDIRSLVAAARREGPNLEYKSGLYEPNDQGNREFLLDVCMFANAAGGTILIGIPETRDENGRPTGAPNASAEIGIDCPNPEQVLLAYETRIVEAIDERLPVELAAVHLANGRYLFGMRIPNSLAKPHRVRYKGHTYVPSRRERHRYELDAREIKDLTMRTASQSERAEAVVVSAISDPIRMEQAAPVLIAALLPVFSSNFIVDLKAQSVFESLMTFPIPAAGSVTPYPSVDGLRRVGFRETSLAFAHNALLRLRAPIASSVSEGMSLRFYPTAIDLFVRSLVVGAARLLKLPASALLHFSVRRSGHFIRTL